LLQTGPNGERDEELLVVLLHVLQGGRNEAEAGRGLLSVLILSLDSLSNKSEIDKTIIL
jgi:hypothetical protein